MVRKDLRDRERSVITKKRSKELSIFILEKSTDKHRQADTQLDRIYSSVLFEGSFVARESV